MSKKIQVLFLHILVWIQFLVLPLIFFPKPMEIYHGEGGESFFIGYVLTNLFLIFIFYFNYLFAIPKLYFKHFYYGYGGVILGIFILSILIALFTKTAHPHHLFLDREPPNSPVVGSMIIRLVIVLVASFGLKIYQRWRQTEIEKANVELSYLKAQINPHFLFNTLNGIYALAVKKSDDTAGAIVKLSSIMRYVINDAKEEYVSLDKELKYVSDYIDLQKMRLNKNVLVSFNQEGNPIGKRIVPMLFVSFIENAFKYGVSTEDESVIEVEQIIFRNELTIKVRNSIFNLKEMDKRENGIGIENSRLRLEQCYPGKHELKIEEKEGFFNVLLKIELK
ncbi:MAG: histidine kinase [Flavobacteriia bacterium]|nr:histidine kinase [Flavobacteriia bacterium]